MNSLPPIVVLVGHFGYAYIDCFCSPFTISSDLCPGDNTISLHAPVGFASYLWSNGDTLPDVTLINPVLGSTYSVTMTSVTGCQVTEYDHYAYKSECEFL
ncbi:MAG: hypothetical protein IPI23_16745 [Bacteroidetes bacterium]|nr:hypothetical protein [Bacteroidota bacterium]